MSDIEDIQEYYADLLILQYRNKPKARAEIKEMAKLFMADGLVFDIQNVLDIDTAQGKQLDIIGKILGQSREIAGLTLGHKYFSFENAVYPYGFSTKEELSEGDFKKYSNSLRSVYSLNDNNYRTLLKFKAIYNLRKGSWAEIDDAYYTFFGNEIELINNFNLSVTYNIPIKHAVALECAIFLGYIKPPLGINYNYNYVQE